MSPYEIIAKKRDGQKLSAEEIRHFIQSYIQGDIQDYQVTAFLMAVYLNGMDYEEIAELTRAYIDSGERIDLEAIAGVKVDKHSTGGVGDKVSIILAPLVAALDVPVPMMSGRGLGHSGGTLDKLESIPGFATGQSVKRFKELLQIHRLGLIGQTNELVPADKRIYALRDVTATVDTIPLIAASIMSKKIAEGIDALVLDVKFGNGAFMAEIDQAEALAKTLIRIGGEFDKQVVACLTSMEQPLGYKIGNWLEIEECLDGLHGKGPADLMEVTYLLAGHMLMLGGKADNIEAARQQCQAAIDDGRAYRKFIDIVKAQGGDPTLLENPGQFPKATFSEVLTATEDGFVSAFDTYSVGMSAVSLGAGRARAEDAIDPSAGIILFKKIGDAVAAGDPLLEIRSERREMMAPVLQRLSKAIRISTEASQAPPLILKTLGA